jgi:hypothetical protein
VPATVIEDFVSASESVGRVEARAEPTALKAPTSRSSALAASRAKLRETRGDTCEFNILMVLSFGHSAGDYPSGVVSDRSA